MRVRLEIIQGPQTGTAFEFDQADSFLVGRSPKAHCVLDPEHDRKISRHHFLIDIRPPRCLIHDLESKNGTFVNCHRVQQADLQPGDEIRAGQTVFRIDMSVEDDPLPPPDPRPARTPPSTATRHGPRPPTTGRPPTIECDGCRRDLNRWARNDGWAEELPGALYLCPTCTAHQRSSNVARTTIGGYRILREIGRGGMGVVFQAVHESTRRLCAVKEMLPDAMSDEKSFRLFDREIGVQSMVLHPNLARILERGRDGDRLFFSVEYLAGGDAYRLATARGGLLDPVVACSIVRDCLRGLKALHDHGFVHRDLKPRNLLLSRPPDHPNAIAKITDYGLAKSYEEAGNSLFDLTRAGEVAGSMMFMAPEQILNYRFVKPPADLYAMGVSLYFLLTRKFPVNFPTDGGSHAPARVRHPIQAMIDDAPIPVGRRRRDLPEAVQLLVDQAVQKDLSARYKVADEFLADLDAYLRGAG